MRDDLPTPIRRDLEWQRREFVRTCGAIYTQLVQAHVDPTRFIEDVKAIGRRELAEAEEKEAA